jgi:hypothetical protein
LERVAIVTPVPTMVDGGAVGWSMARDLRMVARPASTKGFLQASCRFPPAALCAQAIKL